MLSSTRRECKPALVQPRGCSQTAKSSRNGEILIYIYPARRAADAEGGRRAGTGEPYLEGSSGKGKSGGADMMRLG